MTRKELQDILDQFPETSRVVIVTEQGQSDFLVDAQDIFDPPVVQAGLPERRILNGLITLNPVRPPE